MKRTLRLVALLAVVLVVFSCGGKNYKELMAPVEKQFFAQNFKAAGRLLLPCVNDDGKDQLLCMMEAGYLLHAGGEFKLSNKILLKADKVASYKPISVSKQVAAFLTNQSKTNYRGEDFELVLMHYFTGMNFIMLRKYDSARVEFKKVNNLLKKMRSESKRAYKQNIMAKYMTAIVNEMLGDTEEDKKHKINYYEYAYVELRQIQKLKPNLRLIYADLQRMATKAGYPEDMKKWTRYGRVRAPKNGGEFIFVYESGKGAVKASRGPLMKTLGVKIRLYINRMSYKNAVRIAVLAALAKAQNPIPVFRYRSNTAKYIRIRVNGRTYKTVMLDNIEKTAIKNLQENYGKLSGKAVGGIVAKVAVSVIAGMAAKAAAKRAGGKIGMFSGLIGTVVGGGTAAALVASIRPDLRCWRTLPANLQISRINLPEGKHRVTYQYISRRGRVLGSKAINVAIQKGKKYFYQLRTLN